MFKENSMCSSVLGQGRMTWLRTSSVSSCWEPICSSVLYEGWTIISVHDAVVQYYTCPIVYLLLTNALLWTASYTCYTTSCPLVHRGRPWEGAIIRNIYIYIYLYIFLSPSSFSSLSLFFFFATCHFWIGSCRFVCPGQLPIYSGIPPLPSTFAKFSPLTFLV